MDCEKFDEQVMDALYGELPELTEAALRRHVESCARCGPAYASLKAAKDGAALTLEEPSVELEQRILAAEKTAYGRAPWHRKVVRAAAWAGSHAMRPQLAMAALFMFVIGSSLLLLRARPGTVAAPVSVDQQGAPELARAEKNKDAAEGDARPAARAAAGNERDDRMRDGSGQETLSKGAAAAEAPAATAAASAAPPSPTDAPSEGGSGLALSAARSLRDKDGCAAAVPSLEAITRQFPGSDEAKQATEELSRCAHVAAKVAAPTPGAQGGATATSSAPSSPPATATVAPGPK
jgi:hypothetical protein